MNEKEIFQKAISEAQDERLKRCGRIGSDLYIDFAWDVHKRFQNFMDQKLEAVLYRMASEKLYRIIEEIENLVKQRLEGAPIKLRRLLAKTKRRHKHLTRTKIGALVLDVEEKDKNGKS